MFLGLSIHSYSSLRNRRRLLRRLQRKPKKRLHVPQRPTVPTLHYNSRKIIERFMLRQILWPGHAHTYSHPRYGIKHKHRTKKRHIRVARRHFWHVRHIRPARCNFRHVWHLHRRGELLPEQHIEISFRKHTPF